jgi:hypothetical protein
MDRMELRSPRGRAGTGTLASRLESTDRDRFVGRAVELAALASCLSPDSNTRVIHVYGPGGIGKSTLLREFGRQAETLGWQRFVVEGRELTPSPDALEALLADAASAERPVVLIDTYERMNGLGGYLRRALLPSLPDTAVVVIAGRNPPEEAWFQGGWESVVGEFELGKLPTPEALALLAAHGITDERRTAIAGWAGGSPLALALAADAASSDSEWDPAADEEDPEILRSLIRRLAEAEIDSVRFSVLAVAAIARVTTADMLAAVLPEGDADGAYERLNDLSFSERVGDGLALHELVRKALRADLRRRDPDRDRELRRRIVDYLYDRATQGDPLLTIEMADLIDNPVIRWGFGWEGSIDYRIDDVRPGDAERMAQLMAERGLGAWWDLTARFVDEAPDRVAVARDRQDHVCGFLVAMTPSTAPAFAGSDPIVGPRLAHAAADAHLGDSVLWHDSFDFTGWPAGQMSDSAIGGPGGRVKAMLGMAGILRSGVINPRFMYLPVNPRNPGAREFAAAAGAEYLPDLDCEFGDHRLECHRIDHGAGGLFAAMRAFVYAEIGLTQPAAEGEPAPAAVDPEQVRDALRSFHVPHQLARSPLASGGTADERAESARARLRTAVDEAFGETPNETLLREVIVRGYLTPGLSHEQTAVALSLSRAAYFRRLRVAADRVAERLTETR